MREQGSVASVSASLLAAGQLTNGQVPLGEAIAFWILAPISLAGAIGMVLLRNAVHSALSLVATMGALGVFYLSSKVPSSAWCRSSSTPARS